MKRNVLIVVLFFILGIIISLVVMPYKNTIVKNVKEPTSNKHHMYNLKFAHNTPEDSALHQAALRYAKLVNTKTNGNINIEVYPAQILGNDHKMVEMTRNGEIDILLTPTAKMSLPVPAMQYADLPFYFPSREDLYLMLDGEPGQLLLNKLQNIGLLGVTFWENGFKHFTGNFKISTPQDFKNKRIRVMKSRIIMEQFKSFDAHPIPIDFHATYKALEDGVVDGQENPLIAIESMGFYKVQTHLTLSSHAYLGYVLSISQKSMENLPLNIKQILVDTAKEVTPWERGETHKREKLLLETIRKAGVKVETLSEENRKKFATRTKHIPKQFEDVIGSEILLKTQEILSSKYGNRP